MKRLDDSDKQIIALLAKDARITNRELARSVGMSESAVRKRLKMLAETGMARITTVVDLDALGLTTSALIRVGASPVVARELVETVALLNEVSFAALMTGPLNVAILISARSREDLANIVHREIQMRQGVHRVETAEIVSVPKHNMEVALVSREDYKRPSCA